MDNGVGIMFIKVILYIIYYVISIFAIYIGWYFRRFTIPDYQYNKNLRVKRYWVIALIYFALVLQVLLIGSKRVILIFSIDKTPFISWSAMLFLIAYIFVLDWVEAPKAWRKRKK